MGDPPPGNEEAPPVMRRTMSAADELERNASRHAPWPYLRSMMDAIHEQALAEATSRGLVWHVELPSRLAITDKRHWASTNSTGPR